MGKRPVVKVFATIESRLREIILITLLSLLILMTLEFVAKGMLGYLQYRVPKPIRSYTDNELMALYDTDDPNYYREVLAEGWGGGGSPIYTPFVEFRTKPHQSKTVNIHKDGFRTNSRDYVELRDSKKSIFVFGGSTTFGRGVADHETIAAALEKLFRRRINSDVNVYNFGVPAFYSTQERIYFEALLTRGFVPDAAIFIDGLNDFYFGDVPDKSQWSDDIEEAIGGGNQYGFLDVVRNRSNVLRLLNVLMRKESIRTRAGKYLRSQDEIDQVIQRLDANRRIIDGIATEFGIKVVFVQQPIPTYHFDNRRRPIEYPQSQLVYHTNSGKGYERFELRRQQGTVFSKNVLWLQELEIPQNQYVNTVHYSPQFSQAIAEDVFKHMARDEEFLTRLAQ